MLLLLFAPGIEPGADTKFTLNLGSAPAITLPDLVVPSSPSIYLMAGVCAFCGALQLTKAVGARVGDPAVRSRSSPSCSAFLTWAAAGQVR